jgi:predicted MFS family arabinose efflux permease
VKRLRSHTNTSKDLVLLLVLVFVAGFCEFSIYVLVPLAAHSGGFSNTWVGVLVGAPQLMLVLALIPGTHWAASWRRRNVLVIVAAIALVGYGRWLARRESVSGELVELCT